MVNKCGAVVKMEADLVASICRNLGKFTVPRPYDVGKRVGKDAEVLGDDLVRTHHVIQGQAGMVRVEDALTVRLEDGLGGDPFPYGIEPNRKGLEALTETAFDQRITSRKYSVEELFATGTLDLVG